MVSAADYDTLASVKVLWPNDKGFAHIAKHQYLESEYTFGASNKCRITVEFTGLIIPGYASYGGDSSQGYTGSHWLQIYDPDPQLFFMSVSSGYFLFNPNAGQPESSAFFIQDVGINGARQVSSLFDYPTFTEIADLQNQVFTLTIDIDNTTRYQSLINFSTPTIMFCEDRDVSSSIGDPPIGSTFKYRAGARLLSFLNTKLGVSCGGPGASNFTITKFDCVDIA